MKHHLFCNEVYIGEFFDWASIQNAIDFTKGEYLLYSPDVDTWYSVIPFHGTSFMVNKTATSERINQKEVPPTVRLIASMMG